ncbi:MAG: hypothetical protein V4616_06455 [Bacteroidota bacterium]
MKPATAHFAVISPQGWGKMFVSKHHYAVELSAEKPVVFINPPNQVAGISSTLTDTEYPGIRVLNYNLNPIFWNYVKFHLPVVYRWYFKRAVRSVLKKHRLQFSEVWCFDAAMAESLDAFGSGNNILFIADMISKPEKATELAAQSNLVVSITPAIIKLFDASPKDKLLINHGLGSHFSMLSEDRLNQPIEQQEIKDVGYVGNLLLKYLNHDVLEEIIRTHPNQRFHFWGAISFLDNNVQNVASPGVVERLRELANYPNVVMHGPKSPNELAAAINTMDAFLVCYDIKEDPNGGANSHKILEYLSTGKVIISSKVADYAGSGLFPMLEDDETGKLVSLFDQVVNHPEEYNSAELQQQRIRFALSNTYSNNILKIREKLNQRKSS